MSLPSIPAGKVAIVEVANGVKTVTAIEVVWGKAKIEISNETHPLTPEIDRLARELLDLVRKEYDNGNDQSK